MSLENSEKRACSRFEENLGQRLGGPLGGSLSGHLSGLFSSRAFLGALWWTLRGPFNGRALFGGPLGECTLVSIRIGALDG